MDPQCYRSDYYTTFYSTNAGADRSGNSLWDSNTSPNDGGGRWEPHAVSMEVSMSSVDGYINGWMDKLENEVKDIKEMQRCPIPITTFPYNFDVSTTKTVSLDMNKFPNSDVCSTRKIRMYDVGISDSLIYKYLQDKEYYGVTYKDNIILDNDRIKRVDFIQELEQGRSSEKDERDNEDISGEHSGSQDGQKPVDEHDYQYHSDFARLYIASSPVLRRHNINKDWALKDRGASIIDSNPKDRNIKFTALLHPSKENYLLIDGSVPAPYTVIQFSEDLYVDEIRVDSFEAFSVPYSRIIVSGALGLAHSWRPLGILVLDMQRDTQVFDIANKCKDQRGQCWIKYMKLIFIPPQSPQYTLCHTTKVAVYGHSVVEHLDKVKEPVEVEEEISVEDEPVVQAPTSTSRMCPKRTFNEGFSCSYEDICIGERPEYYEVAILDTEVQEPALISLASEVSALRSKIETLTDSHNLYNSRYAELQILKDEVIDKMHTLDMRMSSMNWTRPMSWFNLVIWDVNLESVNLIHKDDLSHIRQILLDIYLLAEQIDFISLWSPSILKSILTPPNYLFTLPCQVIPYTTSCNLRRGLLLTFANTRILGVCTNVIELCRDQARLIGSAIVFLFVYWTLTERITTQEKRITSLEASNEIGSNDTYIQ